MADGYFGGGLAKALARIPGDITNLREQQSLDQYRKGYLELSKSKQKLDENTQLFQRTLALNNAAFKQAQDLVAAMASQNISPLSPEGQKPLIPIISGAVQNAKMLDAINGGRTNYTQMTVNMYQALVQKPTAEAAAKQAGAAEGAKKAASAAAVAKTAGIPIEQAQTAAGLRPKPPETQLKMAINKKDPTDRRMAVFSPGQGKSFFTDSGEEVGSDYVVITPSIQATSLEGLGLGKTAREKSAVNLREGAAATARIGELLKKVRVLGSRVSGIRGAAASGVGGVLGQFNKDAERSFNALIGAASPEEIASFRAEARAVVASLVPETTGEGSERISDTERQIAQETLRLLELEASPPQMTAALAAMLKLKVLSVDRERFNLMGDSGFRYDLENKEDRKKIAKELAELGMNEAQIIGAIFDMRAQRKQLRLNVGG